jgi:phosphoserine phosphatase
MAEHQAEVIMRRGQITEPRILSVVSVVLLTVVGAGFSRHPQGFSRHFQGALVSAEVLPSWNDGPARRAIVDFVARVTRDGGPEFVPEAERVATFDNDGTLWAEKPVPFQVLFAFDRIRAMSASHPEWGAREPYASVLREDMAGVAAAGEKGIVELMTVAHSGMTTEEFSRVVQEWIATARHPQTKRLYTEMVYQPMLELLAYLRGNGFKTYIVSGGGVEFMRPWAERVYGIPPEQVIGSSGKLKFEMRSTGPVLTKLPEIDFIDDKEGKPVAIQSRIGRRPIAAFGNSDGDLQMLQWAASGPGARFALFVHHDDAAREFAYDRSDALQKFSVGWDEAIARKWIVVSMRSDWKTVFPSVIN